MKVTSIGLELTKRGCHRKGNLGRRESMTRRLRCATGTGLRPTLGAGPLFGSRQALKIVARLGGPG